MLYRFPQSVSGLVNILTHVINDVRRGIETVDTIKRYFTLLESGETPSKQAMNVDEWISAVCANYAGESKERDVKFRQICDLNLTVNADKEMLNQVLDNLITNGLKFAPENSFITILVEELQDTLEIKVANTGTKLTSKELEQCFEPRFSTGTPYGESQGLGLGLPIARSIALLHNGDVRAANTDSGVEFTISLPIEVRK